MKRSYFAVLSACFIAPACHHFAPADKAEPVAVVADKISDIRAVEMFATDAIYTAHPTRALVDVLEVTPAAELGRYMVHIEMTGSPEFRDVFDLVVFEQADGALELVSLEQVQGG